MITAELTEASNDAFDEAYSAARKWPPYNSAHEGLGVLLEKVHELQAHVFAKQSNRDLESMRREAIQVAAVAIRFAAEVCNEKVGRR